MTLFPENCTYTLTHILHPIQGSPPGMLLGHVKARTGALYVPGQLQKCTQDPDEKRQPRSCVMSQPWLVLT